MSITLSDGLIWYGVFLFSTICHEAAHAWTALRLGDKTAALGGQVSLNPLPHVRREPIGMLVVPLLTLFANGSMIGWASAPYNPDWARGNPRRAALMALAGPGANLMLALAAALLIGAGVHAGFFMAPMQLGGMHMTAALSGALVLPARLLSVLLSLNLLLSLYNIFPVPPLDGSNIPMLLLPSGLARRYFDLMRAQALRWVGFLIAAAALRVCVGPLLRAVAEFLYPGVTYR